MAAFNRPTEATYEVHEKVTVDTSDNEDHTFCGIMFPVKCKDLLPLDHLIIKSVAVRGMLGPLTVWVNNDDAFQRLNDTSLQRRVRLNPRYWTKLYDQTVAPSPRQYRKLELSEPIVLKPGDLRVLYIHSTLHDDSAIVYDNTPYGRNANQFEDDKLAIMSGRAHVSTQVFGQNPIWGYGNAWRDRREFVGRLEYGTVFKLWNPQVQPKFGSKFQEGARQLFLCQRRWESQWSKLPDECIFYILNMCRWDWFDDSVSTMKARKKREKTKLLESKAIAAQRAQEEAAAPASVVPATTVAAVAVEDDDEKPAACTSCCRKAQAEDDDDDGDDDDDDDDDDSMEDVDGDYVEADDSDDNEHVDSDDDDSEAWSEEEVLDPYHRANTSAFEFRDYDSDEESNEDREAQAAERLNNWRSNFARIHVLRALASMEDTAVAQDYF
mmetsp:Transcript_64824/g.97685  ORF Transcript_64824/g.97685 Transcript_64824/m.97685 type:complete len:438 (-) Transcript_64824:46-1359(-)